MISSMLLFFRRDCDEGWGPAVEAASPVVDAPVLVPVVAPSVGAGIVVDVDEEAVGCVVVVAALAPKRFGVAEAVVPAAEDVGADVPPPRLPKRVEVGALVGVGPLAAAVVVAPAVAGVLVGADVAGFAPNSVLPPVDAPAVAPMPPKRLLVGAADDVGGLLPPRVNPVIAGACDEIGCAGVPRLNVGALLAGVADGVLLPNPGNRFGLGVSWPGAVDAAAWLPPPNRFPGAEEVGVALWVGALEVLLLPPNRFKPGVELPRGLLGAAPPNKPGVPDDAVVAGFAPNGDELVGVFAPACVFCPPNGLLPGCVLPPVGAFGAPKRFAPLCVVPPVWLFWPPKRLGPGGAPAGVVEGKKDVLVAAGVAAGVDAAVLC